MVPRSHSRAMVSAVSMAAMIDMITTTRPGTTMFTLSRVWLYHTLVSTAMRGCSTVACSRVRAEKPATIPLA